MPDLLYLNMQIIKKPYVVISTSLVSFKNIMPTIKLIEMIIIGYHSPAYIFPVNNTIENAIVGKNPPTHPFPK